MNFKIIKQKSIIIICFIMCCLFILSSCSNPYANDNKAPQHPEIPTIAPIDTQKSYTAAKGHVTLGLCDFDVLNPLQTQNEVLINYLSLVYDSIICFDTNGVPKPMLSSEFYTNDGGLSWTIVLKDNILFHDGSKFTSYDVKNTIEWIKKNNSYYSNCVNNVKAISIIKNNELLVTLNEHDSLFPSKLYFPIIKSEDLDGDFKLLNGTGMYKHVNNMQFEIFPDYYGEYPNVKSFEILTFKTSKELYESNTDIMLFHGDDVIKYTAKKDYSIGLYENNIISCLMPSPKIDISLRSYINNAIDKTEAIKAAYAYTAIEKEVPINEKIYFLNKYEKNKTLDDVYNLPQTIKFIVNENDKDLIRLSEVISKQFPKEILIETIICSEEEYNNLISTGDYDFAYINIKTKKYPDFYDYFYTDNVNNLNKYSNKSADSLIISIKEAFKNYDTSLVTNYEEFCTYASEQTYKLSIILEETMPLIPICQRKSSIMIKDTLSNISLYNFNFWNTLSSFKDIKII